MVDLQHYLGEVTGLPAVSLQPAAGSQGELTGMLIFAAYHQKGQATLQSAYPGYGPRHQPGQRIPVRALRPCQFKSGPDGVLLPGDRWPNSWMRTPPAS
jgi:glycine dehydrogenase subunit 2